MTSEGSERDLDANLQSNHDLDGERDGGPPATAAGPERADSEGFLARRAPLNDSLVRQGTDFDPTPFIRQLRGPSGGTDYLDVKWRLLWLRKEHPDAEIVTELVQHDPQMAIFKATVTVPTGGKATGYGSETASDFPDFIEKAETKAIGRALNALGYGAQFGDFQRSGDLGPDSAPTQIDGERGAPAARPVALPRPEETPQRHPEARVDRPSPARPVAPTRSQAASPSAADSELVDYSWSAFWPWARERGLNGPKEIENLIGQQVAGLSPAELRDFILAADARR